jgi:Protein of unknown function (DUF2442)
MMIDVIGVRPLGGHRLEIAFSDGTIGVRDFAATKENPGPMAVPLKDATYFARVFIDDGALSWPNGYDWDPETLHAEMKAGGLPWRADAAEQPITQVSRAPSLLGRTPCAEGGAPPVPDARSRSRLSLRFDEQPVTDLQSSIAMIISLWVARGGENDELVSDHWH